MNKVRIDIFLTENGYADTRAKAQRMIMAGDVLINDKPVRKASQTVLNEDIIRIKEHIKYVSRGAFKLEKALDSFKIDVKDKSFIDFGASTGGFTDLLLQRGASHVTCVDVGYGQLAWKIRNDKRVKVLERTNARYLTPQMIREKADGAVCDVSFISVKKIIPAMEVCTKENSFIIILIKPQFEAGKGLVGRKGIVKNKNVHIDVIGDIIDFIANETLFVPQMMDYSPIKGQKGNIEYLLYAKKNAVIKLEDNNIKETVSLAFSKL